MKPSPFIYLTFLVILLSCSAKKPFDMQNATVTLNGCPKNGDCTIELIENSSFNLQQDGTGQAYPKIETNEEFDLYKITYERKVDERIMDAQYREVIYFQINKKVNSLNFEGKELSETNLTYARLCYCPGSTGYESITNGKLTFEKKNNQLDIQLEIKPQQFSTLFNSLKITLVN